MKLAAMDYKDPNSFVSKLVDERWRRFVEHFPNLAELHVIDLGGVVRRWLNRTPSPASLTVVNLTSALAKTDRLEIPDHFRFVAWNVLEPAPPEIADATFDLVHSNSLIEHLGGSSQRAHFAATVRELAPRYWIQTPNRNFPIEPHWLFPGFQFLPLPAKAAVSRWWPLGSIQSSDWDAARRDASGVELLTARDLQELFPSAEIVSERMLGLSKSLIAVQR